MTEIIDYYSLTWDYKISSVNKYEWKFCCIQHIMTHSHMFKQQSLCNLILYSHHYQQDARYRWNDYDWQNILRSWLIYVPSDFCKESRNNWSYQIIYFSRNKEYSFSEVGRSDVTLLSYKCKRQIFIYDVYRYLFLKVYN
jgi:hypothetical protein